MKTKSRERILVLRTSRAPVALNDERFLRSRYDVRAFRVRFAPKLAFAANLVALAFWLCVNLPRARGVFCRFADYYAVLPVFFARLFRRRCWIVLGGYDAHWFPEYAYGVYHQPFRAVCVRFAIRNATEVLPVHSSLFDGTNAYAFNPPRATGIRSLVPRLRCGVRTIPDGFDAEFWKPTAEIAKERLVVAVASVPLGMSREARVRMAQLKGVPLVLEMAKEMPDVRFVIVGPDAGVLHPDSGVVPANVTLPGHVSPEELRRYFERAAVCAHPSLTEGLPAAVAEAMLCSCRPVGSSVNGIPDLIGDTGIVVVRPKVSDWVAAVEKALTVGGSPEARKRIIELFSLEKRFEALAEVLGR